MNSRYEFADYRARLESVKETMQSWCAHGDCVLEATVLLDGARLRMTGPDETVRDTIRTVRLWIRNTI
jgi:hypothetical protein